MVTPNVDSVYERHVSNHARFHGVVYFNSGVSTGSSRYISPPCVLLKLCVRDFEFI